MNQFEIFVDVDWEHLSAEIEEAGKWFEVLLGRDAPLEIRLAYAHFIIRPDDFAFGLFGEHAARFKKSIESKLAVLRAAVEERGLAQQSEAKRAFRKFEQVLARAGFEELRMQVANHA